MMIDCQKVVVVKKAIPQVILNKELQPITTMYLRKPYDNIATMLQYNRHQKFSVNETHK